MKNTKNKFDLISIWRKRSYMKLLNEIPTIENWILKNIPLKAPRQSNSYSKKNWKRCLDLSDSLYYDYLLQKSIIPHFVAFKNNHWKESQLYLRYNSNIKQYEIRAFVPKDNNRL